MRPHHRKLRVTPPAATATPPARAEVNTDGTARASASEERLRGGTDGTADRHTQAGSGARLAETGTNGGAAGSAAAPRAEGDAIRTERTHRSRSGTPTRSRRGSRARRGSPIAPSVRNVSRVERAAAVVIGVLIAVTPLVVLPEAKESFRLVQGLAAGWLGLASLVVVSWSLRDASSGRTGAGAADANATVGTRVDVAALWRYPAIRALVPLAVVVAAGGLTTAHPVHFRAAFADFAIGVACVIGWSLALRESTLRWLLAWTIVPAVIVSLLAIDQALGLFGVLDGLRIEAPTARLRITSTIGNPGDLASFLVLPALIALDLLRNGGGSPVRVMLYGALLLMLATIALTATLAALGAVGIGIFVWWWSHGVTGRTLASLLLVIVLGAGSIAVAPPVRSRVIEKAVQLAQGDVNALLTGRLDGWRAAWAMLQRAPIAGVGQGAFRAEFAETRLALTSQGVRFYEQQRQVMMATPHNEALSVGAEQGIPGLLALAWAIWCLWRGIAARSDRALARAAVAALGVLCVFSFPLHVPAVAWPWLLCLAWIFHVRASDGAPEFER